MMHADRISTNIILIIYHIHTYILIYTCIYIYIHIDIHLCIHTYINEGACACIRLVLTLSLISLSAPWLTRYSTISLCPLTAALIIAVFPFWLQEEVVDKPYKMAVHQITSMIIWACKEETNRKNRRGEKRRKKGRKLMKKQKHHHHGLTNTLKCTIICVFM